MATRGRRWCFTLNNYTEEDCVTLSTLEVKSIVVGKEKGESGTEHLQGFVKFNQPKKLSGVKKILPRAHWEIAKGSDSQNLDYCSKETVTIKKGVFTSGEKGGGGASFKLAFSIRNKRYIDMTPEEIYARTKHEKALMIYKQNVESEMQAERMRKRMTDVILKPWQLNLAMACEEPIDDRKVKWYIDFKGNTGKTFMADYLVTMKNAVKFENGKTADIAFAYKDQRIVIFDFSRSQENFINYGVLESFKNGYLWSPKYESTQRQFEKPHVIVFSNFEPDRKKLSQDRWDIRYLSEKK